LVEPCQVAVWLQETTPAAIRAVAPTGHAQRRAAPETRRPMRFLLAHRNNNERCDTKPYRKCLLRHCRAVPFVLAFPRFRLCSPVCCAEPLTCKWSYIMAITKDQLISDLAEAVSLPKATVRTLIDQ